MHALLILLWWILVPCNSYGVVAPLQNYMEAHIIQMLYMDFLNIGLIKKEPVLL